MMLLCASALNLDPVFLSRPHHPRAASFVFSAGAAILAHYFFLPRPRRKAQERPLLTEGSGLGD